MMSVSEIGRAAPATIAAQPPGNLGRNEFLQLLLAQLQHQNPLQPLDNEAFVAQLAQFRALEEMENVRQGIELETAFMSSLNNSAATSLIGREAVAAADSFDWDGSAELAVGVESTPGSRVSFKVLDESGRTVLERKFTLEGDGIELFAWTGKDSTGRELTPGLYRMEVTGTDAQGATAAVSPLLAGRVTALSFLEGATRLLIEGTQVNLAAVREVHG